MRLLSSAERAVTVLLGYAGAVGLLFLQRPWTGDPPAVWAWAGVAACVVLVVAGALGRRGTATVAAFLVAAAPWDFAYPAVVPFLVLGVLLITATRRPRADSAANGTPG